MIAKNDGLDEGNLCPNAVPFRLRASTLIVGALSGHLTTLLSQTNVGWILMVRRHGSARCSFGCSFGSVFSPFDFPCAAPAHFHVSSDALTVGRGDTTKAGNLEEEEEEERRGFALFDSFFFVIYWRCCS